MHEIITLQLGQRSNYVATHFWNTQESYFTYSADEESLVDHNIHFRPGVGVDGTDTFTPRTVIYDLKGGFGTLKKINALYELEEEDATSQALWNGPTVIQRQTAIEKSTYQQSLENGSVPAPLTNDSVRYWSDFNRVYFHPKSIIELDEYELGSALMPFESWRIGEELFNSLDKEHDVLDRDLRPFVEEADQMQGIQLIASLDDAWGGFAAKYMDHLRDEYGKTTVWVWGLEDGLTNTPREKQLLKLSNTARSVAEISPQSSVFIPVALPAVSLPTYVTINRRSAWHISALLSTAVESMTIPSRLRNRNGQRHTLGEMGGSINANGNQNIAKLQMSIVMDAESPKNGDIRPGRLGTRAQSRDSRISSHNGRVADSEMEDEIPINLDMDLFPSEEYDRIHSRRSTKKTHLFGQTDHLRSDNGNETNITDDDDFDGQERARRRAAGLPILQKIKTSKPFSILDSFPPIYSPIIQSVNPSAVSVRTSLSTDTSVAVRIKSLQSIVSRSIALDEREALSNSLAEIAEAYEEGWDSGSDEDDD